MKKEILLINPWIYDFAAYDFWVKPLGLLIIGSILRNNGYSIHLIDCLNSTHPKLKSEPSVTMPRKRYSGHGKFAKEVILKPHSLKDIPKNYNRYGITPKIFIEELQSLSKPDIILVTSMMTYWYPGVFDVIHISKSIFPDVPVVLGGNYVTLCQEHAALSGADIIIPGEGEARIAEIFKSLLGEELSNIPDLDDLDSYPYPAYDLLSFSDQLPILTSRGCPFRCTYCASHLLSKKFRRRDPIRVVDEISYWNSHLGITHFAFYDDALLINPEEFAIPMLKEIINRKLSCNFHCPNGLHLREISYLLSQLMFQAGFKTIRFGFESSDQGRQMDTGGKATNDHLREAIISLKQAGYRHQDIGIYLLCGLPYQETQEVIKSIEYVKSCGARPIITEYSPIPGTSLWETSVASSIFDISKEPLFHNNSLLPCHWEKLTYESYQELKLLTRND